MAAPSPSPAPAPALAPVRTAFRALAPTIVPEAGELDEEGWRRAETIIEDALADRPESMKRQLRLFVRIATWLPLLRYGRPFTRLSPERRAAFLKSLQDAPFLLLRRGFWGLRTLVFMGYYGQPEVQEEIGYAAHPRGWLHHSVEDPALGEAVRPTSPTDLLGTVPPPDREEPSPRSAPGGSDPE